jgi:hypothetical protein
MNVSRRWKSLPAQSFEPLTWYFSVVVSVSKVVVVDVWAMTMTTMTRKAHDVGARLRLPCRCARTSSAWHAAPHRTAPLGSGIAKSRNKQSSNYDNVQMDWEVESNLIESRPDRGLIATNFRSIRVTFHGEGLATTLNTVINHIDKD